MRPFHTLSEINQHEIFNGSVWGAYLSYDEREGDEPDL